MPVVAKPFARETQDFVSLLGGHHHCFNIKRCIDGLMTDFCLCICGLCDDLSEKENLHLL